MPTLWEYLVVRTEILPYGFSLICINDITENPLIFWYLDLFSDFYEHSFSIVFLCEVFLQIVLGTFLVSGHFGYNGIMPDSNVTEKRDRCRFTAANIM